jgi:hypothetical protein
MCQLRNVSPGVSTGRHYSGVHLKPALAQVTAHFDLGFRHLATPTLTKRDDLAFRRAVTLGPNDAHDRAGLLALSEKVTPISGVLERGSATGCDPWLK